MHSNILLKDYTTMRLGGRARFMVEVSTRQRVQAVVQTAFKNQLNFFVLGGGSNIIAHDDGYDGIVMLNRIKGYDVVAEDTDSVTITVGAGEIWDDVVAKTVQRGLTGIEAMSGVPGTCGAAPVQNIGAYGQELADTFVQLDAYDAKDNTFVTLTQDDCNFSYRNSIFRSTQMGRYVIVSVTLKLYKSSPQPPFYRAVQDYFTEHDITEYTPFAIREAVLSIRANKLPDPAERPNSGSFFKNAIVEHWQLTSLQQRYPDVPHFAMEGSRYKIPTGWLIDTLGFKGKLLHGIRVNQANALVLINESANGYEDLAAAREEIITAVRQEFGIAIEQEPLELVNS